MSFALDMYDRLEVFPFVLMEDQFSNFFSTLFAHEDAYDYYGARGVTAALTYLPAASWRISLTGLSENQQSLAKHTEYSFFNRSEIYPDNPSIVDGRMNSFTLSARYATTEMPGITRNAFSASTTVEYSDPSLKSDYSFTQINFKLRGKISTMNYNLLFPPSLTVIFNAEQQQDIFRRRDISRSPLTCCLWENRGHCECWFTRILRRSVYRVFYRI